MVLLNSKEKTMTRKERTRYEMLLRVRDFGTRNQNRFPESSDGAEAFATVARAVADIDAQATNKVVVLHEARRSKAERRKTMLQRMRTIARTSRGIHTPLGTPLRLTMPTRTSDVAVVRGARTFLQEAEPYQDQMVRLGLPATYFAELRDAADAFEAALTERRAGRSGIAGAQAGIKAALTQGTDAARTLDIIVANTFGADPIVMAAWERDRRLVDGRANPHAGPNDAPAAADNPPADAPPASASADAATPAAQPEEVLRKAS
jgi:hypothetical protein